MRITYTEKRFRGESLRKITLAQEIIDDYQASGYALTIRQLYYQFVSRNIIANTEREYKNLIDLMTEARMGGLISWEAIEDRTREYITYLVQEDAGDSLMGAENNVQFDLWARQEIYVEYWVEKEALLGVVQRPCERYSVPYMACKGYLSASEAWRASQRFLQAVENGKVPLLLHLGDHDPSGIDMTRDNLERLNHFLSGHGYAGEIKVRRLGLNRDQVKRYRPPPNPAKLKDSRADAYIAEHGSVSWELDALEPRVIDALIADAIRAVIDVEAWNEALAEQTEERRELDKLSKYWPQVKRFLEKRK